MEWPNAFRFSENASNIFTKFLKYEKYGFISLAYVEDNIW